MEREEARFISRLRISISTAASNIISSGAPPLPADIGADVNVDGRADPPLAGLCLRVGSQLRAVVAGNARLSQSCAAKADADPCTYLARSRSRRHSRIPYSQLFVSAPGPSGPLASRIRLCQTPDTRRFILGTAQASMIHPDPRMPRRRTGWCAYVGFSEYRASYPRFRRGRRDVRKDSGDPSGLGYGVRVVSTARVPPYPHLSRHLRVRNARGTTRPAVL